MGIAWGVPYSSTFGTWEVEAWESLCGGGGERGEREKEKTSVPTPKRSSYAHRRFVRSK